MLKNVVAAYIVENGHFLICRRPANKRCGLQWEFVGGKVEEGESLRQALIREVKEELDIVIEVGQQKGDIIYDYGDFSIHLYLFECVIKTGQIKLLEHVDSKWVKLEDVCNYDLALADKELIKILQEGER